MAKRVAAEVVEQLRGVLEKGESAAEGHGGSGADPRGARAERHSRLQTQAKTAALEAVINDLVAKNKVLQTERIVQDPRGLNESYPPPLPPRHQLLRMSIFAVVGSLQCTLHSLFKGVPVPRVVFGVWGRGPPNEKDRRHTQVTQTTQDPTLWSKIWLLNLFFCQRVPRPGVLFCFRAAPHHPHASPLPPPKTPGPQRDRNWAPILEASFGLPRGVCWPPPSSSKGFPR